MRILMPEAQFSLKKTFECGQCFRFEREGENGYAGVAMGRLLHIERAGDELSLSCSRDEFEALWKPYFDLDADYARMTSDFIRLGYVGEAVDFGRGIRILRQDPWEALCSFILSQCSNIPRIKGMVERLCRLCGGEITSEGRTFYSFPPAERVAALSDSQLDFLRCGYRAQYIKSAALAVADGLLAHASALSTDELRDRLTGLRGVGQKVADCVLLFGFHRMEAFPADVWIKRAIAEKGVDPDSFGQYAGLAQQYIFYYIRESAGG